jgi:hypothetical protein
MLQHKLAAPVASTNNPALVSKTAWDGDAHKFTGGTDGQVPVIATSAPDGFVYGWAIPAIPVSADSDIPEGQGRAVLLGPSGSRTLALRFRINGIVWTLAAITDPDL